MPITSEWLTKMAQRAAELPDGDCTVGRPRKRLPMNYELIETVGSVPIKAWTHGVLFEGSARWQVAKAAMLPVELTWEDIEAINRELVRRA